MSKYFPFLRGKQHEFFALRHLCHRIADEQTVCPIIELVNDNTTTKNSLDQLIEAGMPFVLVSNPEYGAFEDNPDDLSRNFVEQGLLADYDNFIPALHLYQTTNHEEVERFNAVYGHLFKAVIYNGEPQDREVRDWLQTDARIYHHILLDGKVPAEFANGIPRHRKVIIQDKFNRQVRNADYPDTELFTDMNTEEGNPANVDWGDYSIVGNFYSESGGAAHSVAVHHIHQPVEHGPLYVNHYLSDRRDSPADPSGKTIEAVTNLVADLDNLNPTDTDACEQYREMVASGNARGLGYLKRLPIMHHIETILRF